MTGRENAELPGKEKDKYHVHCAACKLLTLDYKLNNENTSKMSVE